MPYEPISKFLSTSEDIRLQHRNSALAAELARTTHFNRTEVQRLLHLYHVLTAKRGRTMDREVFARFMDVQLGVRDADAMGELHQQWCRAGRTGRQHMTGREFVELLSLVLAGPPSQLVHLCFGVYRALARSLQYVGKEDVLAMARRNRGGGGGGGGGGGASSGYDQVYADHVMRAMDKDRDNRISAEDYRQTVDEDVGWLQFLGPVLPEPEQAAKFHRTFSKRPYVSSVEVAWMEQRHRDRVAAAAASAELQAFKSLEPESKTSRDMPLEDNSTETGDNEIDSLRQQLDPPQQTSDVDHKRRENHVSDTMPYDWYLF